MKWKYLTYLSFAIILVVVIKWIVDSNDYGETLIFTRDSKAIEKVEIDELFGTETVTTEWQDGNWLGLLPGDDQISPRMIVGVVPISGIFFVIGMFGIIMNIKASKRKH